MKIAAVCLLIITMSFYACAHVISEEVRLEADPEIAVPDLFKNPEAYRGKTVILGGNVIRSRNTPEGTYVEVLQKPLDSRGRPEDSDFSYGRFIVLSPAYLDNAVFSSGREVTVAGEVIGKKILPLDDIQYPYTLLKSREIHLSEQARGMPFSVGIGVGVGSTF